MNKDILEGMWNKQHVERVEVVLKESVDVSGKVALVVTHLSISIMTIAGISVGFRSSSDLVLA